MKLFHWNRADALKRYSSGDITAMAEDVEAARAKVIAAAAGPIWFKHRMLDDTYFDNINGDDADDWRVHRAKLLLDLEAEPIIVDAEVIMIWGSE